MWILYEVTFAGTEKGQNLFFACDIGRFVHLLSTQLVRKKRRDQTLLNLCQDTAHGEGPFGDNVMQPFLGAGGKVVR